MFDTALLPWIPAFTPFFFLRALMTQLTERTPRCAVALPETAPFPQTVMVLKPQEIYNGGFDDANEIRIRISNGGAGQTGLVKAWADAFIQHCVDRGIKPFLVGWYLGDTTQSLTFLAQGAVDLALTYNEAAEMQSIKLGACVARKCVFFDHFLLVGPKSNPADLKPENDTVLDMFNKIVTGGNADTEDPPDPTVRPPTRFLSRFDKSATNIKESELFVKIGQVPWALPYATWYHQFPKYPLQALQAASLLSEYTLVDKGVWLSSAPSVVHALEVFKAGTDDYHDPLINIASLLLGSKADPSQRFLCEMFLEWSVSVEGGQKVIREFKKNGQKLYTPVPRSWL